MPTNEEIAAARARGSEAHALMEELLLAEQQQQQAQNPAPSLEQPPLLPPQATAGMASNLYTAAYGATNQAPAAVQPRPVINSRTGQQVATTAIADGPPQRVTTNEHARVLLPNPPNPPNPTDQSRPTCQRQRRCQTRRRSPEQAAAAAVSLTGSNAICVWRCPHSATGFVVSSEATINS